MTTPRPESRAQRSATRAPVGQPVKLQFDDSMDVVDGLCENISIGGMFIQVVSTRPQGSLVRFELQIDDNIAIRGLGEVVWNRTKNAAVGSEAGIGIKFRFLEQRDRQLIFKLVSQHIKERLAKQQLPTIGEVPESPPMPIPPPAPPPPASPETLTMTAPLIASPDGPRVVDVVVDDLPATSAAAELDDEEPTIIGKRSVRMAEDVAAPEERPPAPAPIPEPVLKPEIASPPAPASDTPSPSASERSGLYRPPADAFDAELEQLQGAPPLSAATDSADRELDRGGQSPGGPSLYSQAPFDELLDRGTGVKTTGVKTTGAVREDSVVARYDLTGASARRRQLLPIAVVVLLALAAAGYWFRHEIFGDDPAATALVPAPAPATAEAGQEAPAAESAPAPGTAAVPVSTVPAPPPPPPPPSRRAAPPSAKRVFSRIVDIRWGPQAGGFRVIIEADGPIPENRYRHFRLDGETPREVIRLLGVSKGYAQSQLAVGSPVLHQIRTGYHQKRTGNELHVVLDMADRRARISDIRTLASGLEILIAGP